MQHKMMKMDVPVMARNDGNDDGDNHVIQGHGSDGQNEQNSNTNVNNNSHL